MRCDGGSAGQSKSRRLAFILANGAYTQRAPLSRPIPASAELLRKLSALNFSVDGAENQDLAGMKQATHRWLNQVRTVVDTLADEKQDTHTRPFLSRSSEPPLIFTFVYCGHGSAGRFFPIDCPKPAAAEDTFCFFADFLFELLEVLGAKDLSSSKRTKWQQNGLSPSNELPLGRSWTVRGVRILVIIESCRRLTGDELRAFEAERARITHAKRHLLPCLVASRPDLASLGGAEWDATRLAFLSQLGPDAPQVLMALSSKSTTASYDVVFLRSITEGLDKPVRLGGILERASLDTLRRTGHKQKPVLLSLGGGSTDNVLFLQDIVLAKTPFTLYGQVSATNESLVKPSRSTAIPLQGRVRRCHSVPATTRPSTFLP